MGNVISLLFLLFRIRQEYHKASAFSLGTCSPDRSLVLLDDGTSQAKADTGTGYLFVDIFFGTVEWLEYFIGFSLVESHSGICYFDKQVTAFYQS